LATSPDDPVYPNPRLDFDRLGPAAPRTYRVVILENNAVRLMLLPELGGRIYQWTDKVSGRSLLYQNPVIKPTRWGRRGWWIGAGGFEWAFPVDEHGFNEYQSWGYRTYADGQQAGVVLARTDERTGLQAEITVALDTAHAYFTVTPKLSNPGANAQSYQFWLNAMLALGGNRVSPDTQFVWPSDQMVVHSSSDSSLFPASQQMPWPIAGGRDLRSFSNWPSYLGFFAIPQRNYMGVYDATSGIGVVRVFPPAVARGTKFFAGPGLDPQLWTDDGSTYLELWGGVVPDFNTYAQLASGQSVGWTERWYATGNIGPVAWASDDLALGLSVGNNEVRVGVAAAAGTRGQLLLWQDNVLVNRWQMGLASGESVAVTWPAERPAERRWRVQLVDEQGQGVAAAEVSGSIVVPAAPAPLPQPTALPTLVPTLSVPVAQPTLAPSAQPGLTWDPRLTELGVRVDRAQASSGQPVWRLVAALYENPEEAQGLHHAFIRVLDEQSLPVVGQRVELIWKDGSADTQAAADGANFPLYGSMGEYSVQVSGLSDLVVGLGLPAKHHVNFRLTFQRATQP
jgi:hypothetical protein